MRNIIGIDLGTTTTLVSYSNGSETQLLNISKNNHIEETCFRLSQQISKEDYRVEDIGLSAWEKRNIEDFEVRTYFEFKPEIGKEEEKNNSARIWLKQLYKIIRKCLNNCDLSEFEIVIGIPVEWNNERRTIYRQLAEEAGFQNIELIPEPVAAGLYAEYYEKLPEIKEDSFYIFFDFGGGTLDLSLIEPEKSGHIKFIYNGGNSKLGGRNFDTALTEYFIKEFNKQGSGFSSQDKIELEKQIRKAKLLLNKTDNLKIPFKGKELDISKGIFEKICKKYINQIVKTLDTFFKELNSQEIKINKNDINEIIKVGGASRMFFIDGLLNEYFEEEIDINNTFIIPNPEEAVVKGLPLYLTKKDETLESIKPFIQPNYNRIINDFEKKFKEYSEKDNILKDFETLYNKYEKKYLSSENNTPLKRKELLIAFKKLTKELFEKATQMYIKKISKDLMETTTHLNEILNKSSKSAQKNFGSTLVKIPNENSIPNIELPENFEEKLDAVEKILAILMLPITLIAVLVMALEKIKPKLKRKLKEHYIKYYSSTPAAKRRKDWRKKGGFFYQIKNEITFPTWENFWQKFRNNFHI